MSSLLISLLLVLILGASRPGVSAAAAPPVATPAASAGADQLANQRVVDLEGGQPLALSPDGRRLAVIFQKEDHTMNLCADDPVTLTEMRCATYSGKSIARDTVVWSPDGTKLAFTEDVASFNEPDIWVFDAEAGTINDLTDDGLAGRHGLLDTGTALDLAPAWSPDGTRLVFARGVKTGENADGDNIETATLEQINAAGGQPTTIATVATQRLAIVSGVRWMKDNTILYSIRLPEDDPANGLWMVAATGGTPRQLVSASEHGDTEAVLVGVSERQMAIIMLDYGRFGLVDLATGQIDQLPPATDTTHPVLAVAFSPDGTQLLFTTAEGLVVRDLATGQDHDLGTTERPIGSRVAGGGLAWATNNLVCAPSAGSTALLIELQAVTR